MNFKKLFLINVQQVALLGVAATRIKRGTSQGFAAQVLPTSATAKTRMRTGLAYCRASEQLYQLRRIFYT